MTEPDGDRSSPSRPAHFRKASWLYFGTAVNGAALAVTLGVLATTLRLTDFGNFAIATGYAGLLYQLFDCRMFESVIFYAQPPFLRKNHATVRRVLNSAGWIDLSTGLFALLLTIITCQFAGNVLADTPAMAGYILLAGISSTISTVDSTAEATLRLLDQYRALGITQASTSLVRKGLIIAAAARFGTIMSLLLAQIIGAAFATCVVQVVTARARKRYLSKVDLEPDLSGVDRSRMLRFAIGTNLLGTLKQLHGNGDLLVVSSLGGPAAAGLYKLATGVADVHGSLTSPLATYAYPHIAKSIDAPDLKVVLHHLGRLAAMFSLPIGLAMAAFTGPLLGLLSKNSEYGAATPLIRIMLIGTTVTTIFFWPPYVEISRNRLGAVNRFVAARSLVSLILTAVAFETIGIIGAAWVYSGTLVVTPIALQLLGDRAQRRKLLVDKSPARTGQTL